MYRWSYCLSSFSERVLRLRKFLFILGTRFVLTGFTVMSDQENTELRPLAPFPVIANGFTNISRASFNQALPNPDPTVAAGNKGTVVLNDGSLLAKQISSSLRVKVDLSDCPSAPKKRVPAKKATQTQPSNSSSQANNNSSPVSEPNENNISAPAYSLRPRQGGANAMIDSFSDEE